MSSKIGGDTAPRGVRASAKYASSIFIASSVIWLVSASARADDSAALQKLEAHLQQLEERHESEIKALQAEIKRLRKQKPATVAATQPPAAEQPRSALLPPGLPPPATPAKVLMTYGNASQPGSPHISDQAPLLARHELRDAWRTRAEVEANLESRDIF